MTDPAITPGTSSFRCYCGFTLYGPTFGPNGEDLMLHEPEPGECCNCGGQRCMACVFREVHDNCRDHYCPDCTKVTPGTAADLEAFWLDPDPWPGETSAVAQARQFARQTMQSGDLPPSMGPDGDCVILHWLASKRSLVIDIGPEGPEFGWYAPNDEERHHSEDPAQIAALARRAIRQITDQIDRNNPGWRTQESTLHANRVHLAAAQQMCTDAQTAPPAPLCASLSDETPETPPVHTPDTAQAVGSEN